jgi:hypothetical protein
MSIIHKLSRTLPKGNVVTGAENIHLFEFLFSNLYKTMKSFNPPVRTLMGPGPSDVHPRIMIRASHIKY